MLKTKATGHRKPRPTLRRLAADMPANLEERAAALLRQIASQTEATSDGRKMTPLEVMIALEAKTRAVARLASSEAGDDDTPPLGQDAATRPVMGRQSLEPYISAGHSEERARELAASRRERRGR